MHAALTTKKGLGLGLATLGLAAGVAALGGSPAAADTTTQSTAVSAGPSTFTQAAATGQPSVYTSQLERCANGTDHPLSGANPILSQPLNTQFSSNVGLSESVDFTGNQYYGNWDFVFTNTSSETLSVDCAVLIFRAPSNSDNHAYSDTATQGYGHPQQDYLEVPRGDGTSSYIVRLGFHDVPLAQREIAPGQSFTYLLGGAPNPAITLDQMRDSMRFTADLSLDANQALVVEYGTNRLSN